MGINISLVIQNKRTNTLYKSSFNHNLRYKFHRLSHRSKCLSSLCYKNYIQETDASLPDSNPKPFWGIVHSSKIHAQIPRKFSYNGETADNPNLIAIPCLHLIYHLYSKSQHRIPQLIPNTNIALLTWHNSALDIENWDYVSKPRWLKRNRWCPDGVPPSAINYIAFPF